MTRKSRFVKFSPVIGLLLLVWGAHAERAPDPPGTYMGREIAQTMHYTGAAWLIRTAREREESAEEMMRELNLKPGMVVADLGCGNGYHAIPMARMVSPGGKILAVDIQQPMLDMLNERAKAEGVEGIHTILGEYEDPKLPVGVVDLLLLVDAYHEFSAPEKMLRGMRASLKEDGLVALVEYRAEDASVPIKPEHKMSKEQILKEYEANGFTLVRSYDKLPWQHLLFFKKAPLPEKTTP
jgi:ubiquinone/menaquinone biosynthesis C-methylase UbiE